MSAFEELVSSYHDAIGLGECEITDAARAELAALLARVEQAERERDDARARVGALESVLSKIVQESSYLDDGVNDAGDCQISRICSIAMYEDSERSAQSAPLTPRRCVTCAQDAARDMREKCALAVRKLSNINSAYEDAIRALSLPSCDGCNPLKPEAENEATR